MPRIGRHRPGLIGLGALLLLLLAQPAAAVQHEAPWQRLVVLGASASVGFGPQEEAGRVVGLAELLDELVLAPHEPPRSCASALFFTAPERWGEDLLAAAERARPTAVIAVDYLFWTVYGQRASEAARLEALEVGLAALDRLSVPLVVGDLPDMSAAIGSMLRRSQVPQPDTLARANARLRAWAATRPLVTVLPLAARVSGFAAAAPDGAARIQPDRLHPTVLGLGELAVGALSVLPGAAAAAGRDELLLDARIAASLVAG